MSENYSLDDLRKKAHEINYVLSDENFLPRNIEIIGLSKKNSYKLFKL